MEEKTFCEAAEERDKEFENKKKRAPTFVQVLTGLLLFLGILNVYNFGLLNENNVVFAINLFFGFVLAMFGSLAGYRSISATIIGVITGFILGLAGPQIFSNLFALTSIDLALSYLNRSVSPFGFTVLLMVVFIGLLEYRKWKLFSAVQIAMCAGLLTVLVY